MSDPPINNDNGQRGPSRLGQHRPEEAATVTVPISSLVAADSPRLAGENVEHIRALAESDTRLPPIVVNRSTMRVIDGMHRLQAALLRGSEDIEVQFHDGDETDSFVLAVEMNIAHGLPLSLSDRRAAAARIIGYHPEWSDRRIAAATGLSNKTIGPIRRRTPIDAPLSASRVGRDGRVRPLEAAASRELASQLLTERPASSLRDVAKASGLSPSTVLDVRERLRNGDNPIPETRSARRDPVPDKAANVQRRSPVRAVAGADPAQILRGLTGDPSLRFNDAGRALLRWLHAHMITTRDSIPLTDKIPSHCTSSIAQLARINGNAWYELAEQLEQREQLDQQSATLDNASQAG